MAPILLRFFLREKKDAHEPLYSSRLEAETFVTSKASVNIGNGKTIFRTFYYTVLRINADYGLCITDADHGARREHLGKIILRVHRSNTVRQRARRP
jgi:hypothetical protein